MHMVGMLKKGRKLRKLPNVFGSCTFVHGAKHSYLSVAPTLFADRQFCEDASEIAKQNFILKYEGSL